MDITSIVQAVAGALAVIMTAIILPYIKTKTTAAQRQTLLMWIDIAVAAAEQIKTLTTGADKKGYVLEFLQGKGVDTAALDVDGMIEAAVWELKRALG